MSSPMIDILLATFNGAEYLSDQLESLLRQTYPNFRILISDDGSTDETPLLIQQYVSRYPNCIFRVHNPRPSQGALRNFEYLMGVSLDQAQAKWIAFADQDDIWLPEKLTLCAIEMNRIESESKGNTPCLVHTDLYVMDINANLINPSFVNYENLRPTRATHESLLSVNVATGCTMLVNIPLLKLALPIPEEAIVHDWWCAIISGVGRRQFLPLATIGYRQHQSNQIGARNRSWWGRLKRLATSLPAVLRRIDELGILTWRQAKALELRFQERGVAALYVTDYLHWRHCSKWSRASNYRRYYVGPELDRLSRWWFWRGGVPMDLSQ
jgi:glycosyltransferase involved in cell wall biosynthesis